MPSSVHGHHDWRKEGNAQCIVVRSKAICFVWGLSTVLRERIFIRLSSTSVFLPSRCCCLTWWRFICLWITQVSGVYFFFISTVWMISTVYCNDFLFSLSLSLSSPVPLFVGIIFLSGDSKVVKWCFRLDPSLVSTCLLYRMFLCGFVFRKWHSFDAGLLDFVFLWNVCRSFLDRWFLDLFCF